MIDFPEKISVIIIEDHTAVRMLTQRFLEGYSDIHVVANTEKSEEGIALVTEHAPNIVLLDMHLDTSRITGYETLQQIVKISPVTRVIIFTAHPEEVAQAVDAGCDGYVLKSDDLDEIVEAIRDVARGERHFSEAATLKLLEHQQQQTKTLANPKGSQFEEQLSQREIDVLYLLRQGKTNKEIGTNLHISWRTAKRHVSNILIKSGCTTRTELATKK